MGLPLFAGGNLRAAGLCGTAGFAVPRQNAAGFWPGIESVLLIVILALVILTAALTIVLLFLLVRNVARRHTKRRLKKKLHAVVDQATGSPYPSEALQAAFPGGYRTFSKRMLAALGEVYEECAGARKHTVRSLILRLGYGDYVCEGIKTGNIDKLILLIRLVGELDLVGLDRRVAALLYVHRGNIDLQYQAYLTLSKLGSHDLIVRVCKDESFVQTLSFRSLQEVLQAYNGDKAALYEALLASPDPFVVRNAIKRIGMESISSLAEPVFPFLHSKDYNLVLDAARTLGQLRYRPAGPHLARLLSHLRWEVRAIVVSALAELGAADHEDELCAALRDPEWQVRYNAARALATSPNNEMLLGRTLATGDRYAYEILLYMAHAVQFLEVGE